MPKRKGPDNDDLLIVIREDGNIIEDDTVRQEHGLLKSPKNGYEIQRVRQVPLVEWLNPLGPPVGDKAAFIINSEPPPPDHDSKTINETLPSVYNESKEGQSWRQRRRANQAFMLRTLFVGAVSIAVVFAFVVMPMMVQPPEPSPPVQSTQEAAP